MVIVTPFYRDIVERPAAGCAVEQGAYYTPYEIFCLRTQLHPHLIELVSDDADVGFLSTPRHNKMYLTARVVRGTEEVVLSKEIETKLQRVVDSLTDEDRYTCLLFGPETQLRNRQGQLIPQSWLEALLPFVQLPEHIRPFAHRRGLYAVLRSYANYLRVYNQLVVDIKAQLEDMYQAGYILHGRSIAEAWELEPMDDQGLVYRPRWTDQRFAPDLVSFLETRLMGDQSIDLTIGENLVRRHYVSLALDNQGFDRYHFIGAKVRVPAETLKMARIVAALVERAAHEATGQVTLVRTNRPLDETTNLVRQVFQTYDRNLESNDLTIYEFGPGAAQPRIRVVSIKIPFGVAGRTFGRSLETALK